MQDYLNRAEALGRSTANRSPLAAVASRDRSAERPYRRLRGRGPRSLTDLRLTGCGSNHTAPKTASSSTRVITARRAGAFLESAQCLEFVVRQRVEAPFRWHAAQSTAARAARCWALPHRLAEPGSERSQYPSRDLCLTGRSPSPLQRGPPDWWVASRAPRSCQCDRVLLQQIATFAAIPVKHSDAAWR